MQRPNPPVFRRHKGWTGSSPRPARPRQDSPYGELGDIATVVIFVPFRSICSGLFPAGSIQKMDGRFLSLLFFGHSTLSIRLNCG